MADVIGDDHPAAVRAELAAQVAQLRRDGTDAATIRAALHRWLDKPGLGPRTLPGLVSDVLRAANHPTPPRSTTDERVADAQSFKTGDDDPAAPAYLRSLES